MKPNLKLFLGRNTPVYLTWSNTTPLNHSESLTSFLANLNTFPFRMTTKNLLAQIQFSNAFYAITFQEFIDGFEVLYDALVFKFEDLFCESH